MNGVAAGDATKPGAARAVLVTGGGRGIGAAVCRLVAQRGYAVAINYLRDEAAARLLAGEIADQGGSVCLVPGDVGDPAEVERMFDRAQAQLGTLFGLINNAGITGRLGRFSDADPAAIEQVFRTNVLGTIHCSRAALKRFRAVGTHGVIVNLSSIAAVTASPNEYVHYAASKSAVETFTLGLAREVAAERIRVCAVAPGSTLTGIHAAAGEPDRPLRVAPKIPMGRLATPEEVAAPVVWLLSDEASYITGSVLRCAGGL